MIDIAYTKEIELIKKEKIKELYQIMSLYRYDLINELNGEKIDLLQSRNFALYYDIDEYSNMNL